MEESERARFVVGVDGSEASVEALRQAQRLASPAGAKVLAILNEALEQAFGDESPPNVIPRVVRGHPRDSLIDASRHADRSSLAGVAMVGSAACSWGLSAQHVLPMRTAPYQLSIPPTKSGRKTSRENV